MRYMISFQCESSEEAQAVLTAVEAIGKQPHACSKEYVEPAALKERQLLDEREAAADEPVDHVGEQRMFPRMNVSPGAPSIGKIGENAKAFILESLEAGAQPPDKYLEHMKLLWSRHIIKFDGDEFYI